MPEVIRLAGEQLSAERVSREWLVTNSLGGYASATVAGVISRRYHGLLIAAMPAELGRMVMLSDLVAEVEGRAAGGADPGHIREFTLLGGLPTWRYAIDGLVIEKSVLLPSHHNIVHITYRLIEGNA